MGFGLNVGLCNGVPPSTRYERPPSRSRSGSHRLRDRPRGNPPCRRTPSNERRQGVGATLAVPLGTQLVYCRVEHRHQWPSVLQGQQAIGTVCHHAAVRRWSAGTHLEIRSATLRRSRPTRVIGTPSRPRKTVLAHSTRRSRTTRLHATLSRNEGEAHAPTRRIASGHLHFAK